MPRGKYTNKKLAQLYACKDRAIHGGRTSGAKRRRAERFTIIDLFCGAGGMTLGFTKTFGRCFEPVWANDFNRYCAQTYNANFGNHCVSGDIVDLLNNPEILIPKADVVVGGPPCQGFSLLNKNREVDPRRELWRPFLEVVERCCARVFVIENVPHLLGTFEHCEIVGAAEKLGFKIVSGKLCAADYGVPQTRIRAVIIGSKAGDPTLLFPPRPTHYNPHGNGCHPTTVDFPDSDSLVPSSKKWRTVRDAVFDLPPPEGTDIRPVPPPLDLHFGRTPTEMSVKRYKAIPYEGMNRFDLQKRAPELTPRCWIRKKTGGTDLFGRLWWDKPAFTMRTEFFKPEKGRYLHPTQNRPITHREAARFQSFPDTFLFRGTKIEIAKQIGNAVPPLLAARLADIVYALVTKGTKTNRH
ncbi:MAG: DNA (cytosine-5-)-methyltransferase [Chitinivibrionales bacterium]|nr:DNA (cytosine-5-)-methyltransferase [Chitinivibrionales bacterium]MBD3356796.1 DNA (cytosine-5-)-methyltransferase [Chitinivibrionales bacterium]